MTKTEVEALQEEFDEALVQAFPGPEPMSVLLVGGACDPEPGTGAADCGPVLSFPCSAGLISVALHIGARVREVTESSRIRVVRSCLLCYAVRGTGLL